MTAERAYAVEPNAMSGTAPKTAESPDPLADLVAVLTSAVESVRAVESLVIDASADDRVRMGDLARVIETVNQLGRAVDGIEARALAAFARRDEVIDADNVIDDPRQVVRGRGFVHEDADLEVSHLVGISEGSASTRVNRSAALESRFPHTLAAITAGDVELWQANQIVEECSLLDDDEAWTVDEWVAKRLKGINPSRIRSVAKYAISRTNPDKLRKRAARTQRDRTLEITPTHEPGLAHVYALIPSHQAAAIWEAADALGKQYRDLEPALTADQARADAFVDLVLADVEVRAAVTLGMPVVTSASSAVGDAHESEEQSSEASTSDTSTRDASTSEGPVGDAPTRGTRPGGPTETECPEDPNPKDARSSTEWEPIERDLCGPDDDYDGPGTAPHRIPDWMLAPDSADLTAPICGFGPLAGSFTSGVTLPKVGYIPADVIARLLERLDLTIARALIDATDGTLLETVTDAYRPNRRLKDFVVVRDGQCRMFGCSRSAARCDLDHVVPHDRGGPTSPANLAGLCRHHHRAKQARHWLYRFDPDTGEATWVNRRTGTIRSTHPQTAVAAHGMRRQEPDREPERKPEPARAAALQFYTGIGPLPF